MSALVGKRFGHLLVVERLKGSKRWMHRCLCDCGNEHFAQGTNLRAGRTTSCGCSQYKYHGLSRENGNLSRLYYIWQSMIQRCRDPNCTAYHNYGGRGISVCAEWSDFGIFHQWAMENGYKPELTIDRIDNDDDYRPDNCRWTTCKEQGRNMRNNRLVTYRGETKCMAEWSEELGIRYVTLYARLFRYGWSAERAFNTATERK